MEKENIVLSDKYEDVVKEGEHLYIRSNKDRVCVMPYTLDSKSLLDKMGVLRKWNDLEDEEYLTVINGYVSLDDETDLVTANRVLFEVLGTNMRDAGRWMFLGSLYNSMTSESPVKLYAVNITDMEIPENEAATDQKQRQRFEMMDSSRVLQSDDVLFLASILRLFSYFYTQSLIKNQ